MWAGSDMWQRTLHIFSRSAELSFADWRYLVIATRELFFARVRHATQPAGNILRHLQEPSSRLVTDQPGVVDLERMSWAIGAAAVQVPWRSDCLLRVMAADRWARRHGLRPEFYLGVKNAAGTFEAHVWLRCDGVTLTGGTGEEYTTLIKSFNGAACLQLRERGEDA
jgi:hypothetical protein